ncbi:molybdopterin-dependent oxidoreductase [Paraburkholderia sp. J10-1]|uniref:molybdopterin-dependent oxidoreductase n=1 Tax=Paraburkholderia sp. J10-1 TaxID=2805430 RepID=UPI002AB6ADB6|nr:molybdopterin-dependent oxidoreductase [Paraburkholderia sp. J10-1]
MDKDRFRQHSSHWGTFSARAHDGKLELKGFPDDPEPSSILDNLGASVAHPLRLARPLVREGWLKDGPGPDHRRGHDRFVEIGWPDALELVVRELRRQGAGPDAANRSPLPGAHVFGGSYGWASAGRFHHAQSQVHRFLNLAFGGYVKSVDSYSSGAGAVILGYTLGPATTITRDHPYWEELARHSELVIAFGGLPLKNTAVSNGGNSVHSARDCMHQARIRGTRFVLVGPIRDDLPDEIPCDWIALRPGSDTAFMLGMAYHLHATGKVDRGYLKKFTVGYEVFERYLTGASDGIPKTPAWAAAIAGVPVKAIVELADAAASKLTFINVSYSLQRAQHGEQPIWMALVLSAMLGHMNKPGGGFSYGLGSIGNIGKHALGVPLPTFSQAQNGVRDFIPVARIADLLLQPGDSYTYKCEKRVYADIRLVYWAGGNPFHHHQDLLRLERAFRRPDTIIVHESVATATTRFADIVLPATTTLERDDIGASANDPFMFAMEKIVEPYGDARDDYDIFADLAAGIGVGEAFTEGRSSAEWLRYIYEPTRKELADKGWYAPDFDTFWQKQRIDLPLSPVPGMVTRFHQDPAAHALPTPSGRIEVACQAIAESPYAGVPSHPMWISPDEWLGSELATRFPFQLVANQPKTRLHSQLDFGAYSASSKISGREPARMNPQDAARLKVGDGATVRIFNDRGATLAGVVLDNRVRPGVIQLATGAWYEPKLAGVSGVLCNKGNPNVVTRDIGASPLSQGCTGQLSLVDVELFTEANAPGVGYGSWAV